VAARATAARRGKGRSGQREPGKRRRGRQGGMWHGLERRGAVGARHMAGKAAAARRAEGNQSRAESWT
jgi:hypothetical protein